MKFLVAAALGFLAGVVGGFLGSILGLQAKRWRNARLLDRGQPGIRDVILAREPILLVSILSSLLSAILAAFCDLRTSVLIGAGAFSLLWGGLWVVAAVSQLF